MKRTRITILVAVICTALFTQNANAQFSGTTPATLNSSAVVGGSMGIGNNAAALERKLNIHKAVSGDSGPSFTNQTTGLRINHNHQTSVPYAIHQWDVACDNEYMHFYYKNTDAHLLYLSKNKKLGIATIPDATFHVNDINGTDVDAHLEGFTLIDGNQASLLLGAETGAPLGEWGIEYNHAANGLNFWKPIGSNNGVSNWHLFIKNDGKVSIGLDPMVSNTFNGDYKLYVADGIMTEKIRVALKTSNEWADYVFHDNYTLMPLAEVKDYVATNKHLPNVPSAEEVVASGYDITTMDATLLQKIEELTLYVIEQQQQIDALKKKLNK